MNTRIWNVIEEPSNDEGNEFIRASFDNPAAAEEFIERLHTLEVQRDPWGGWFPTRRVETAWLYGSPPDLVNFGRGVRTVDEAEKILAALDALKA